MPAQVTANSSAYKSRSPIRSSIHCCISPSSQATILAPSFTGLGKRPSTIILYKVELANQARTNTIDIVLEPDSRLTNYQNAINAEDYNMQNGKRVFSVRSALVPYAVQALNLDLAKIEARPEAQQIMVANWDEVKRHTF